MLRVRATVLLLFLAATARAEFLEINMELMHMK